MTRRIVCFASHDGWVAGATEAIVARLRASIAQRRRATLLLSGGSTPRPVYEALAQAERVDWACVHFFWGDERPVPADHPDSNFRMARESLLDPLAIAPTDPRVHRCPTEAAPRDDAAMYEANLRLFFDLPPGEPPRFDVALLGMGDDGHTASLFPGTEALDETRHLVVANPVPQQGTTRLTVTLPLLNAARAALFLVQGAGKAARVAEILTGTDPTLPAALVTPPDGDLVWLLDAAAASQLPTEMCKDEG